MARFAGTGLRAHLSSLVAHHPSVFVSTGRAQLVAPVCWYVTQTSSGLPLSGVSKTKPETNTPLSAFMRDEVPGANTMFSASTTFRTFHTGTVSFAAQPQPVTDDTSRTSGEPVIQPTEEPVMRDDPSYIAPHPGIQQETVSAAQKSYMLSHPVYTKEYVNSIKPKHKPPVTWQQKLGYFGVQTIRRTFDWATGYGHNKMTESKWIQRIVFLETIAGVPGMVAGMLRHMRSLRAMKRDHGWIHTLLEEAENERMHLLTFLEVRQPGVLFRGMVLLAQGVFFNAFFLAYLVSPRICHSFVGYLEEEAVKTYTHALADIDSGVLKEWQSRKVPEIAMNYWRLPKSASMRDLILAVRADEACHGHVNHTFANMPKDADNPFSKGSHMVA